MMTRLYLDLCSLKRPWDDQSQARIAEETSAILAILQMIGPSRHIVLRSPVHDEENSRNIDAARAAVIAAWLAGLPECSAEPENLEARARVLHRQGLGAVDALHLAWAEALRADLFITTDDNLVKRSARAKPPSRVRVVSPLVAVKELRQ